MVLCIVKVDPALKPDHTDIGLNNFQKCALFLLKGNTDQRMRKNSVSLKFLSQFGLII